MKFSQIFCRNSLIGKRTEPSVEAVHGVALLNQLHHDLARSIDFFPARIVQLDRQIAIEKLGDLRPREIARSNLHCR